MWIFHPIGAVRMCVSWTVRCNRSMPSETYSRGTGRVLLEYHKMKLVRRPAASMLQSRISWTQNIRWTSLYCFSILFYFGMGDCNLFIMLNLLKIQTRQSLCINLLLVDDSYESQFFICSISCFRVVLDSASILAVYMKYTFRDFSTFSEFVK